MSLNSESIQKKEFHIVFKGYKPEEVDKFLDILALEFDGMQKKVSELEEKIDSLKYEGDNESSKMRKVIQEALISAHRVAEEIKQKAKIEAEELVGKKKMEEEQKLRDLQNEKISLESSISRLKDEYAGFKNQISKFADDFKQKMMNMGDGKLLDALKNVSTEQKKPDAVGLETSGELEKPEPAKSDNRVAGSNEEVIYKHARKEKKEENIGENDLKDLAALTDEMLEKLNKKEEKKEEKSEPATEKPDRSMSEKKEETEDEKTSRKKIDIANPDIINDFFKTDEA